MRVDPDATDTESILPSYRPWPASSARPKCTTPRRLVSPIATPTSRAVPGRSTRSEGGSSSGGGCSSCGSGNGRQQRTTSSASPLHKQRQTLRSPVTEAELQLVSTFTALPTAPTRRSPVRAQPASRNASPPQLPHPVVVPSPDIEQHAEQHAEQHMCSSRGASSRASPSKDRARDPTLRRGDEGGLVSASACKDVVVFGVALMLIFLVVLGLATGDILPGLLPWLLIGLPLVLVLLSILGAQRAFAQFSDALGWQLPGGCCDCLTFRREQSGHQRVAPAARRGLTLG